MKFSSNIPEDYCQYLSSALKMHSRPSLGTYLGHPVDLSWSKCQAFQPLVDKVVQRLSAFASLRISTAAKLVLINLVLVASFTHVLSVFLLPSTICDRIDNLLARFWWRSGNSFKGLALVHSQALHLSKGLGGIGIRHLASFI